MKKLTMMLICSLILCGLIQATTNPMLVSTTNSLLFSVDQIENQVKDTTKKQKLLEEARLRGTVRVIITYDVNYIRPISRNQVRSQEVDLLHKQLTRELKGFNTFAKKELQFGPRVVLNVDEESLRKLYTLAFIKNVRKERLFKLQLNESKSITKANSAGIGYDTKGNGKVIVIIDTGVDKDHEMLVGKAVDGACFSTTNYTLGIESLCPNGLDVQYGVDAGVNCSDVNGCDHGTHVAGIAVGNGSTYSGIAPNSNYISIQAFSKFNNQVDCGNEQAPCIRIAEGDLERALEETVLLTTEYDIASVNMSFGGGDSTEVCDNDPLREYTSDLLFNRAIPVAASGNDAYSNGINSPACIPNVVSVGATDKQDVHWSESDTVGSNAADFLDLVAPGVSITSSVPGNQYEAFTGTSQAAPHVAGTIALLQEANNLLSTSTLIGLLKISADKVDGMNDSLETPRYGDGRLNVFQAVTEALIRNPSVEIFDFDFGYGESEEETFKNKTIYILPDYTLTVNGTLLLDNTELIILGTLAGNGNINKRNGGEIITRLNGVNNFQGNTVDLDLVTIKNDLKGYEGGELLAGVDGPAAIQSSPYKVKAPVGSTLNFEAIDDQSHNGYAWLFNDNEGIENKSEWLVTKEGSDDITILDKSTSITVNEDYLGSTITGYLRPKFNLLRNDFTELGTFTGPPFGYVVEQNSKTISVPSTKTVNGRVLQFAGWGDSQTLSNPRTVTPTDHTTYTALYKDNNISNLTNTFGEDQRRKMAEDWPNGIIYRVYESGGRIWYQWRDRNTNSWSFEREVKRPSGNTAPVRKPSIAVSGGKLWVVFEYVQDGCTMLATTVITDPTAANPTMESKEIAFFTLENAIPELSTAGRQVFTPPSGEIESRAVIFAVVLNEMGMRIPAVFSLSTDSNGDIRSPFSHPDFLKEGRGYANTEGGISVAANLDLIGFTWSDNDKVYFNRGSFSPDGFSIGYSLVPTEVVSDYNPQYEGSRHPTISLAGDGFSVAFKTLWNSTGAGPLNIVAETDVTSRPEDLTLYALTDGSHTGPEFYYPMMSRDISLLTGTKEYIMVRQSGVMKLYEKLPLGWQFHKSKNVSDRTVSHLVSEAGVIASHSESISGLPLLELKEYETYTGGSFKAAPEARNLNKPVTGIMWKEGKDETLKEFWIGGISTQEGEIPLETNAKTRYELKLTEPFLLSSKKIDLTYTFGEEVSEVPFEIALFDTSGNKVAELTKSWQKGQKSVNPTLKYNEAMSSFRKAFFHIKEFTSEPVQLKVVSKDSTVFTWMQLGLESGEESSKEPGDEQETVTEIPATFELYNNYPNPFNPSTNIVFDLPENAKVKLQVFDISGRLVTTMVDGNIAAGKHQKLFRAGAISSGVYFARLTAIGQSGASFVKHMKMTLIK